jgi:sugar phosphate isomerase/epimerase
MFGKRRQRQRVGGFMRYGICLPIKQLYEPLDFIEQLQKLGYDYIELMASEIASLNTAEFDRLKNLIGAAGIGADAVNVFIPHGLRVVGEDADLPRVVEYAKRCFDRLAEINTSTVVFGSGAARNIPQGFSVETAKGQFCETLAALSELAYQYSISLAVEPLNKNECNFINSLTEGLEIVHRVSENNVGLTADYYHLHSDPELYENLVRGGNRILHTHFAEPVGRVYPTERRTEYEPFFEGLRKIGYDGCMSLEAGSEDILRDAGVGIGILKVRL